MHQGGQFMESKSRKTFIEQKIDDFLKSSDASLKIRMYNSEIRKFLRWYPEIRVNVETKTESVLCNPLRLCTITRNK